MKQRKVWTKVLAAVVILYGVSRFDIGHSQAEESGSLLAAQESKSGEKQVQGAPAANDATTDASAQASSPVTEGAPQVAAAAPQDGKAPDLQFEELSYNFGKLAQDDKARHVFKFTNKGNAELVIGEVRASCGCTAALASAKNIAPGESGSIDVTFDSRGKRGQIEKHVTVSSNDPDTPQSTLTMVGEIAQIVVVEPPFATLGNNLPKGKGADTSFRIWRDDKQAFKISRIESDSASVTASTEPVEQDGNPAYQVNVKLVPNAPPGRYVGVLKVFTDIPNMPQTEVRFYGSIRSEMRLTPKYAVMGQVPVGSEATKTLTLERDGDGPPLQIVRVTDPAPYIRTSLKTIEEGRKYEMQVTLDKNAPAGSLKGEIIVETNMGDEEPLRIPIYGYVGNADDAGAVPVDPGN